MAFGEGLTTRMLETREPLLLNRTADWDAIGIRRVGAPARSYLGVPIVVGETAIGAISVQSTTQEGRFGEADARLLATIAANVGVALQNARLYQEAHRRGDEMAALAEVGQEMTRSAGLESNRRLLARLTDLAAELEAQAAATSYRFGASRAYAEIVRQRLDSLRERPAGGHAGWAPFLWRRMAPAMRTAQAVEDRQTSLSTKLARSANLLRTRVDIELESQNRDLLAAMNRRTQLQLRLQQTVEGLSVAAVSYYVVGLVGYAAKGAKTAGLPLDPEFVMAVTVPLALVALALVVRRIRRRHRD
jgi:uncharacterized membrane-anchored protein